jgi:hypothetical protein
VIDVLNSPLGTILVFLAASVAIWLVFGWWQWRERRRWKREDELRQQLWEVEQQIWRESLPDWQREAIEKADRTRTEIKREARRRLGLPEEGPPAC